ncbi:late embryogenesis abundant protein At5g17165 [Abrus precatorius]|uniref:Late embryogenesis abundant protein At5g17165 n=1 Tax=Abrus precatorius TaxID=3816 RepID=A0A8B8LZU1_ABRPR|nr:late embryogenesis abundant protein At5g17165 [Abrus precatorius]
MVHHVSSCLPLPLFLGINIHSHFSTNTAQPNQASNYTLSFSILHCSVLLSLCLSLRWSHCMAANSSSRGITALGKRVANRIWTSSSPSPPSSPLTSRRVAAYSSSLYDKNPDDQIHSGPVPDDVIHATQSGKYWAPHPQTGVFGPPGDQVTPSPTTSGGERSFHSDANTDSVLEEKAWFRPTSLEDLEKPHSLP